MAILIATLRRCSWGGTIGGLILGATPGLSPTMAVALLIPFTFQLTPVQGLILLGAAYTSTVAGGAVSAILLKIPGAPANIATALNGNAMAVKGEGARALHLSFLASGIGGVTGVLLLIFLTPLLAQWALAFGPSHLFWIAILGVTVIGSPGIAYGNEVIVADDAQRERPRGEEGEICVRGPNVLREYRANAEATREALASQGWLRTGDLGRMDEGGYVFVTGRLTVGTSLGRRSGRRADLNRSRSLRVRIGGAFGSSLQGVGADGAGPIKDTQAGRSSFRSLSRKPFSNRSIAARRSRRRSSCCRRTAARSPSSMPSP